MKLFITAIVLFFIVCAVVPAGQCQTLTTDGEAPPLIRPTMARLTDVIRSGRGIMSREGVYKLADAIGALDQANLRLLKQTPARIDPVKDVHAWVYTISKPCPAKTPMTERSIYAALHLQLDMLDRTLFEKNRLSALALRETRKRVRIRQKGDHFFGDGRDTYTCSLLETMEHIGQVQGALGIKGDTTWCFPKGAKSKAQIEAFLLDKTLWVQQRSRQLLAITQSDRP